MCKLTSLFLSSAVALALLAGSAPAQARSGSDWRDCNGRDVDARISACSRIIDEAAVRNPTRDPGAYNNRGNTYRRKGDYDRALRDFDDAIKLNPREAGSIYGRSQVYADKGDTGRAIADLDEAIRL